MLSKGHLLWGYQPTMAPFAWQSNKTTLFYFTHSPKKCWVRRNKDVYVKQIMIHTYWVNARNIPFKVRSRAEISSSAIIILFWRYQKI